MEVFVVLSRDSDYVYVTADYSKAEQERLKQIENEEMQGGRPSVYIRKTTLQ
jgi:hypothetical protein